MKVALILTGLARKVEEGYNQFWKHVLDNYDVDVYLHCWKDEEWEKVPEVYPNNVFLCQQEPFKFTEYQVGVVSQKDDKARPLKEYDVSGNFRQLPMFYSWQAAYRGMKASGKHYDCIIRSRYDMTTRIPLNLRKLDLEKINISGYPWPGRPDILDDNICVTNMENSDIIFSNIFDEFAEHIKSTGEITFAEKSFSDILRRRGVFSKAVKTPHIQFDLLRIHKIWY